MFFNVRWVYCAIRNTIHAHVITFNNYETEIIYTNDVVYDFLLIFVDFDKIFDALELIKYLFMIFEDDNFKNGK